MTGLQMEQVSKSFSTEAGEARILRGVSLTVPDGALTTLLGRSGCGKTTLLRIAAGYEAADSGCVLLDGVPITGPSPRQFLVFQRFDQLFPWKRVGDNLVFALRRVRPELPRRQAEERARFWLAETGLADAFHRWPGELSGGMQQRAALARAFALDPRLLLLDEPFAGLDAILRKSMQKLLRTLCQTHAICALFVTHDIDEALFLSANPAVMRPDGSAIEQLAREDPGVRRKIVACLGLEEGRP